MTRSKVLLTGVLTTVALTGGLAAAAPAAAASSSGNAILATPTCGTLRDLNPWTYFSAWCGPKTDVRDQLYSAWIDCQGRWGTYRAYGNVQWVPWTGKGAESRAQCDSGDRGINSGVRHYGP